jgi:outer membrane protein TolC
VAFLLTSLAAAQETPLAAPSTMARPAAGTLPSVGAQQNPFFGGMPQGQPTPEVIGLSLHEAISRGLKYNLGLFVTQQGGVSARAARLRSLSEMLPNLTLRTTETTQQLNLAALGFSPSNLARSGFSSLIVGPFDVFDARALVSESLDFKSLNNFRANSAGVRAAEFSIQDARDLVVLVVGFSYISAVAGAARVEAVGAQVSTAESLYQQALDLKRAGMIAGIDLLRAQVELQVQQQRLLAVQNDFEKQKLTLGRAIGLPAGQQLRLTDAMPYAPAPPLEPPGVRVKS